jgi:hypothetical protein
MRLKSRASASISSLPRISIGESRTPAEMCAVACRSTMIGAATMWFTVHRWHALMPRRFTVQVANDSTGGSMAVRRISWLTLRVPDFSRMLRTCVRTVHTATSRSSAISRGVCRLHRDVSTAHSAGVRPCCRPKASARRGGPHPPRSPPTQAGEVDRLGQRRRIGRRRCAERRARPRRSAR